MSEATSTTVKSATAKSTAKKTATRSAAPKTDAATKATKAASPAKPAATRTRKSPTKADATTSMSGEQRYKMVEVAAYYIAEKNGFAGNPSDYWIEAEAQISAMLKT